MYEGPGVEQGKQRVQCDCTIWLSALWYSTRDSLFGCTASTMAYRKVFGDETNCGSTVVHSTFVRRVRQCAVHTRRIARTVTTLRRGLSALRYREVARTHAHLTRTQVLMQNFIKIQMRVFVLVNSTHRQPIDEEALDAYLRWPTLIEWSVRHKETVIVMFDSVWQENSTTYSHWVHDSGYPCPGTSY